jgi:hypothetical protein
MSELTGMKGIKGMGESMGGEGAGNGLRVAGGEGRESGKRVKSGGLGGRVLLGQVSRVGSRGLFFAFDGVLELEDGKVELDGSFGIAGL